MSVYAEIITDLSNTVDERWKKYQSEHNCWVEPGCIGLGPSPPILPPEVYKRCDKIKKRPWNKKGQIVFKNIILKKFFCH